MSLPGYDAWKTRSPYDEPGYCDDGEDPECERCGNTGWQVGEGGQVEPCPECQGEPDPSGMVDGEFPPGLDGEPEPQFTIDNVRTSLLDVGMKTEATDVTICEQVFGTEYRARVLIAGLYYTVREGELAALRAGVSPAELGLDPE